MDSLFPWVVAAFALLSGPFANSSELFKVNGVVKGMSTVNNDNIVDGAIVLPSLSAEDLFQFQIDQFMGPPETMTVGGLFSAEVPSNFYLPQQRERKFLMPVNFGKERFSLYVEPGDKRELVSAWFQLPFDKLIELNNNGKSATWLLPFMKIKKHAYLEEMDWSSQSSITMNMNKDLGPNVRYTWSRGAVSGDDTDGVYLFQETPTNRWVFVNLYGNPSQKGGVETMRGLEDSFKMLFIRTHSTGKDVTSAEGYIRSPNLSTPASVSGIPSKLSAKISSNKIMWSPIDAPGWITLTIAPKKEKSASMFAFHNLMGGFLLRAEDSVQMWLDPKVGSSPVLPNYAFKNTDITLAYVGTSEAVPMPEEGSDNSAFLDVASEIRMIKLQ